MKVTVKCNHCDRKVTHFLVWMHETGYKEINGKWYCEGCRKKITLETVKEI